MILYEELAECQVFYLVKVLDASEVLTESHGTDALRFNMIDTCKVSGICRNPKGGNMSFTNIDYLTPNTHDAYHGRTFYKQNWYNEDAHLTQKEAIQYYLDLLTEESKCIDVLQRRIRQELL